MLPPDHASWSPDDLRRLLSKPRFERYVAAAGSARGAAELYAWNTTAAGALHETLGAFEVVLRNALDRQLSRYHQIVLAGDGRWWADSAMPWSSPKLVKQIARARAQASRDNKSEIHGKVIAELTFGVWRFMLAATYQGTLWAPAPRRAFPHLGSHRRQDVYSPVDRLNTLRNRIAHHEPIYTERLDDRYREVLRVAGWIDSAAEAWIDQTSRVPKVLAAGPRLLRPR